MRRDFRQKKYIILKYIILAVLGTLLAADAAMAVYSIRMASSAMSPQQKIAALTIQLKLLRADLKRARDIAIGLPTLGIWQALEGGRLWRRRRATVANRVPAASPD